MIKNCCFTSLLLCITVVCFSQFTNAERRLDSLVKKYNMVGLSVAVVKKGNIVYSKALGLKNKEKNTALAEDDIFRIASISKSFSATAVMQLAEAKKLSLNDDVSNLIGFTVRNPHFPGKPITLEMLMSHTSSLNDKQGYFTLDSINPAITANWQNCYNDYAPGEGYEYCNLNYNMVGTIIERVSGERFDKYIKAHILDKLGLYGGYEVGALDSTKFVTLYEYDSTLQQFTPSPGAYNPRTNEIVHYIQGYSTPVFSPTGGMKISATGLAKYMAMHMYYGKYKGQRIISRKSAETMQQQVSEGEGGYGLAIMTTDKLIPGKIMKGHTGSAYGLYSMMFFQPKEKFGIVVITNGCNVTYEDGLNAALKAAENILYEEVIR